MYKGVEIDMRYVRVIWNLVNETSLSNDPSIDIALRHYSPPHKLSAGFILMLLKKRISFSKPFQSLEDMFCAIRQTNGPMDAQTEQLILQIVLKMESMRNPKEESPPLWNNHQHKELILSSTKHYEWIELRDPGDIVAHGINMNHCLRHEDCYWNTSVRSYEHSLNYKPTHTVFVSPHNQTFIGVFGPESSIQTTPQLRGRLVSFLNENSLQLMDSEFRLHEMGIYNHRDKYHLNGDLSKGGVVKGSLNLNNTRITQLPKTLKIEGDLYCMNSNLLPQNIKCEVGGSVYQSIHHLH